MLCFNRLFLWLIKNHNIRKLNTCFKQARFNKNIIIFKLKNLTFADTFYNNSVTGYGIAWQFIVIIPIIRKLIRINKVVHFTHLCLNRSACFTCNFSRIRRCLFFFQFIKFKKKLTWLSFGGINKLLRLTLSFIKFTSLKSFYLIHLRLRFFLNFSCPFGHFLGNLAFLFKSVTWGFKLFKNSFKVTIIGTYNCLSIINNVLSHTKMLQNSKSVWPAGNTY